jgi:hypothetical protein
MVVQADGSMLQAQYHGQPRRGSRQLPHRSTSACGCEENITNLPPPGRGASKTKAELYAYHVATWPWHAATIRVIIHKVAIGIINK